MNSTQYITAHLAKLDKRAKRKGISRKRWLRAAGVHESTWSRWSRGISSPRFSTIEKLENALR